MPKLSLGLTGRAFRSGAVLLATALILAAAGSASAGTVTITSGPSISTSGAVSEVSGSDTITYATVAADHVKIYGTDDFMSSGGDGSFTVTASGDINANTNDVFTGDYIFTLGITGTGTISYNLKGTIEGGLITIFNKNSSTMQGPGSKEYTGEVSYPVPIAGASIPYTLTLTGTFDNATAGDTVSINVPPNSIDLTVAQPGAVPEPAAMPLLLLGAAVCAVGCKFLPGKRAA